MKQLCTFVFTLSSCLLFGQTVQTISSFDTDSSTIVGTYGEIQYNSRAITNQFAKAFYQGEYLSDDIKSETIYSLSTSNGMGVDANYGLYSSFCIKNFLSKNENGLALFFGVYDRSHTDLNIPGDLFKLVFEGNKQFAGQQIDMGGFEYNQFQYQQLQLGLLHNNGKGERIGFGVSYLNGRRYLSYALPQFDFYTSEIGDVISADWNFTYKESDPEKKTFGSANGYGLSSQFFYQYDYGRDSARTNFFRFEIIDLGFINWNQNSVTVRSKDSLHYDGYYIENVQQIHDTVLQSVTAESLRNRYSYTRIGKITTYLPATISINVKQYHTPKFSSVLGLNYRTNANYNPYVYFEEHYQALPQLDIAGRLAYGGYGKLALGIRTQLQVNGLNLIVGSNNLEGLFAGKKVGAFSVFGGLSYKI